MSRSFLVFLLVIFFAPFLHAQAPAAMAGTAWKGSLNVPDPLDCVLKFSKDTIRLIYVGESLIQLNGESGLRMATGKDSVSIESMVYTQSGDTIILNKIAGGSPCSEEIGIYQVKKADDKLHFILVKDACTARQYCFKAEMTRVR